MKKSISITLACAIGSGLGAMCAIALGAFWILGLILGAVVGYLIYDFNQVIKAIPQAFEHAKSKVLLFDYSNNAKLIGKWIIGVSGTLFYIIVYFIVLFLPDKVGTTKILLAFCLIPFIATTMIVSMLATFRFYGISEPNDGDKKMGIHTTIEFAGKEWWKYGVVLLLAPLLGLQMVFVIGKNVLKLVIDLLREIFTFIFAFLWKMFKLIHSDIRLLVGIDSFIGGAIGFYFESPFIGMAVGAVWGFINYHIVSIRILKLKPTH